MVALTSEVAQLREAHITQSKTTTAMEIRLRNEQEKLRDNEKNQTDTFRSDFECSLHKLRANLESLHTELESSKIGEREERTKLEEQLRVATSTLKTACKEGMEKLRQEIEQTIEAESGGNKAFEQSMETKLEALSAELHGLRDNQRSERTNQQAQPPLGQTVEKLGHLVEKQTEFLGNLLPKLLGQQEVKEDTKRERDFTPSTKDPCKAQGVLPNLRKVDTAAVKDISVDYSVSRNPKQHAFSDVFGAKAVMMGLNAKTEAQVTSKKSTITPIFSYANDSDRRGLLIDLILFSAYKGNTIIYVNDEQRRNHLAEFLLDHNLGEFSERILRRSPRLGELQKTNH